jgi:hypothetical protein
MSASKVERKACKRRKQANRICGIDFDIQSIKLIFYLFCSGVRHDMTYGHSNTDVSTKLAARDIVPTEHCFEFAHLHGSRTHNV